MDYWEKCVSGQDKKARDACHKGITDALSIYIWRILLAGLTRLCHEGKQKKQGIMQT